MMAQEADMINQAELKKSLAHVFWIAGAPDAGKTSVPTRISEKYDLQLYSLDEHAEDHWINHVSQDPTAFGYLWMSRSLDERWLQPPEQQMQNVLRILADDFAYVVEDLLALPREKLILVEGNISPQLVAPLLSAREQAIWMVPTASFYRNSYVGREKHLGHKDRSNPQQVIDNHIARDMLFAKHVKTEALAIGLEAARPSRPSLRLVYSFYSSSR
jgi:hypothetical protein